MALQTPSFTDKAIAAVSSPLKAFNGDSTADGKTYTEKDAAQMALITFGVGAVVGHKFGHKLIEKFN